MQAVQHESSQSIIIGGKWVLCSKKMMVRYATRLAAFKHPNVTEGYSVGTVNEQPYALMEYREEFTLEHILNRVKKPPMSDAVYIAIQFIAGLGCLAKCNCLHARVDPENVLIGADGIVRLNPWPKSDKPDAASGNQQYVTHLAPDQIQAGPPISAKTGVYGLGVLLHQLLADDPSMEITNPAELLMFHLHDGPAPLTELDPSIPQTLSDVVSSALEKNPEDRIDLQNFRTKLMALGPEQATRGLWFVEKIGARTSS